MRRLSVPVAFGMLLGMGSVVAASPPTMGQLFKPDAAGCLAAEAGALDLSVKVTSSGTQVGMPGSGLVSGFLPGDGLMFLRRSKAGQGGLRERLSLSALVPGEQGRIAVVFALSDMLLDGAETSQDSATFAVPADAAAWALFTGSAGEGPGQSISFATNILVARLEWPPLARQRLRRPRDDRTDQRPSSMVPCPVITSTCRSLTMIPSDLCRFPIVVLQLAQKAIHHLGPLLWHLNLNTSKLHGHTMFRVGRFDDGLQDLDVVHQLTI
jgi:hypothetical protein